MTTDMKGMDLQGLPRTKELVDLLPADLKNSIKTSSVVKNVTTINVPLDIFYDIIAWIQNNLTVDLISFHASDEREASKIFKLHLVLSMIGNRYLTITTDVNPAKPSYKSITPVIYAAYWYEREIKDFFGIIAEGHPDPRPLVLWDNWPENTFPLRKDFAWNTKVPPTPANFTFRHVDGDGVFEVSVGPVHAGIIEPGHFRFSVAGEPIINLEIRLGYVHKGIEKLSEQTPYENGVYLAERVSGDNGLAHAVAYCQAVENLAGVEIPARARYIRTVLLEFERLYNLFRDVAGITLVTAFNTGAMLAYSGQEELMQLNDVLTGSRFLRGSVCVGGVRQDLRADDGKKINEKIDKLAKDLDTLVGMVTRMPSLLDRTQTTGVLTKKIAKDLDFVGPVVRACGIDRDVRRDHPYAAYGDVKFDVVTREAGDVHARYLVKIGEIYQAMKIIKQALENMPAGPLVVPLGKVPEGKVGFSLVEAPRGEVMHWILGGKGKPYRHKIRDPSFNNWVAIEQAAIGYLGNIVPDFPLINKSMNLSYSGNDL
jgi:Ni,Fe-hydrogenase III large subunit/Ni,Fe-hydrogenase III component G